MKKPPKGVDVSQIEKALVEKYPHKEGGLNPTQVLRQSIAAALMEAIDPELSMLNTGEFRVKYTTSRDTYDQLRTDPEIAKHVDKINKIFKELPRWVQRSTYYWEDPIK